MTNTTQAKTGISRRSLLKTGAAAVGLAAGSGVITGFPTIWAQSNITLRQFGTGHAALQDGPATEAAFSHPRGLCILRDWLYVADAGNHSIRRIQLLDGTVETVLGTGRPGAPKEGRHALSNDCALNQPWALALL